MVVEEQLTQAFPVAYSLEVVVPEELRYTLVVGTG